jgi:capsular exopolysaccharide synthesis family protein
MNEESVSFHDHIDVVYRKKWLIVMVFMSVFLTTLYVVQRQPQNYESKSSIYLEYSGNMVTPAIVSLSPTAGKASSIRPLDFYLGLFDSRSFRHQVFESLVSYSSSLGMPDNEARKQSKSACNTLKIRPARHRGYYNITVEASSPDIAYAADSIATFSFTQRCREVSQLETDAQVVFIGSQFDSARISLFHAEDRLQDFRKRHNLLQLDAADNEQSLPVEYVRLVEGFWEARQERQAAEATLEAMIQTSGLIKATLDSLSSDPIGRAAPAKEHADVLERARRSKTELQIKVYQEKSFGNDLREYESDHPELPTISLTYLRLSRERQIYERMQTMLMERREELRVQASSESGGVKVIDTPTQGTPVPSKARVSLIVGVIIGLVFGIGVAFFWEYLDSNVKSTTEVTRLLGITSIGAIPSIGSSRRTSSDGRGRRSQAVLISEGNPKDPVAEAYRALRTSLFYSSGDDRPRAIVVSSSGQAEGKSITTANLAITCAQMGQRTVLIDGDLRRPVQHSLFGLEREGGLTEYLLQDLSLDDVAKPSDVENLDIITAGLTPPNPAPLLGSDAMHDRLDELRSRYDLILIDTPPIIAVTDAVLLGRMTDGILLVIRCASTPREAARHALSILENSSVPILGGILNDVDVARHYGGYYYYNYYYHYYYGGYYGADGDKQDEKDQQKGVAT